MQNDILIKIEHVIASPLDSEPTVLYVLAQIRKYLDASEDVGYSKLRLFCNWAVHHRLEGRAAQEVVAKVDNYLEKSFTQGCTESDIRAFERLVSLDDFRTQLRAFLMDHGVDASICDGEAWWGFLSVYARIVEDCPLVLSGLASQNSLIDTMIVAFAGNNLRNSTSYFDC